MGELEKTEARLAAELKNMINVADEEKENLNAVHDKLDRQRKVDAKNEVSFGRRCEGKRVGRLHVCGAAARRLAKKISKPW